MGRSQSGWSAAWARTIRGLNAFRGRLAALSRPLAVPAFRRLWAAQLVSEVGDWSARLVLSLLVYGRTGSPAVTALVTTASLVPWLGPGQLLTSASERWPRRTVMVASDLVRAAAFTLAVLPLPVGLLLAVVFCAGLATPPFEAARAALRPEVIPEPLLPPAVALSSITQDLTVAVGYATGGALAAVLGGSTALLVNAASFAASGVLLAGLPPATAPRAGPASGALGRGWRALRRDPLIVRAVLLVTAAMLTATSLTAVAAPLVLRVLGAGPATAGALVALAAIVSIVATAAIPADTDPVRLLRWAAAYALTGGLVTVGCFAAIGFGVTEPTKLAVLAFAATGLLFAVIAPANVVVSPRLPAGLRASALSLLMGALVATEAAGAAVTGLAASAVGLLPVCSALGVPAAAVGAYALLALPADEPASLLPD